MSGYSCSCGAVSTSPANCCGRPMGSAPEVKAAAIRITDGDRTLTNLLLAANASKGGRR